MSTHILKADAARTDQNNSPIMGVIMHDAKGHPLQTGNVVLITRLYQGDEYCNVELETLCGRRPDGESMPPC